MGDLDVGRLDKYIIKLEAENERLRQHIAELGAEIALLIGHAWMIDEIHDDAALGRLVRGMRRGSSLERIGADCATDYWRVSGQGPMPWQPTPEKALGGDDERT